MSKDRGYLGKIADRVRKESQLPIYPVRAGVPTDDHVFWDGKDVGEFLALAKKVGAVAVYLDESVVEEGEKDPDYGPHIGETSSVQVSFLLGGKFHTFVQVADWVPGDEEPEGEEEPADEPRVRHLFSEGTSDESMRDSLAKVAEALASRRQELVTGYLDKLRTSDETPPDPDSEWDVRRDLLAHLADTLDLPGLKSGSFYFEGLRDSVAGKALGPAISEIVRKLRATDRATVEEAVAGCVDWASRRDIPLRSLSAERIREYVDEKGLRLSRSGIRELRDRVSAEIKRKRTGGSHHG